MCDPGILHPLIHLGRGKPVRSKSKRVSSIACKDFVLCKAERCDMLAGNSKHILTGGVLPRLLAAVVVQFGS